MAAPARLLLADALGGVAPAEPRCAPWEAGGAPAAASPAAASPAASTPRSAPPGYATPRRLLLAESLAADSPARDLAAPAAPPEPPVRLSLFESLLDLSGPPAVGSGAELALLGPPPGLPAPPGLEEPQVKADVERTCSAFSDGSSSESTAAGSASISEPEDFASRSPESAGASARGAPPFGRLPAPPPRGEAEPFNPLFAALFGVPPMPADLVDTLGPAATPAAPPAEPAAHDPALCQPCAWFWKQVGCKSGAGCEYCHVCPDGAIKHRKRVSRLGFRTAEPPAERQQIRLAALL